MSLRHSVFYVYDLHTILLLESQTGLRLPVPTSLCAQGSLSLDNICVSYELVLSTDDLLDIASARVLTDLKRCIDAHPPAVNIALEKKNMCAAAV